MKKRDVLDLIRYHVERNEAAFRTQALEIARDFDYSGDASLAENILSLLSTTETFVAQSNETDSPFLRKITPSTTSLPLPDVIAADVQGIINAIGRNIGISKFIFQGPPGTGKTETAKQIARILNRDLFLVDFSRVIDSKLGQTSKNLVALFQEINGFINPTGALVFFDEIDALVLDRIDGNDVREMGRATSTFLCELDQCHPQTVIIASTNLYAQLDKALVRRFDAMVDFGRYTKEDLIEIAGIILSNQIQHFKSVGKNKRMFDRIIGLAEELPYPGELTNMIKTALAFSSPDSEFDYMVRLYKEITGKRRLDAKELRKEGFTLREIECLTGIAKSSLSRNLQE